MSLIRLVLFFTVAVFSGQAISQNKVVVIPLFGDPDLENKISGSGGWNCNLGESCQDVYEFSINEPGAAKINVDDVAGSSVLRMAVYGPGQNLGGNNLLTGNTNDLECLGQNARYEQTVNLAQAGDYKLAVTRDWGSSAGFNGTYSLELATTVPRQDTGRTANDVVSLAAGSNPSTPCSDPSIISSENNSWNCLLGESCQDVFEFSVGESGSAIIEVDNVTGNSVPLLALYGPGADLGGSNLITGNTTDQECVGQNTSDSATVNLPGAGIYKLAIGRDWGSSAGFNGTYTLRLYTSTPRTDFGQTVNDVDSLASGTSCPP